MVARGLRRTLADDWDPEVAAGYALAGFLSVVLTLFTLLALGPLVRFDAYFNLQPPPSGWRPVLQVLDRVGQRAICLPILAAVLWYLRRQGASWRPVVVSAASVFFLNLLVLVLKLVFGRGQPVEADPSFFVGGMAYPSGHTANIVLMYGLMVYVLSRYGHATRRATGWRVAGVVGLGIVMLVTSLTLNWHWFADLVAGLLVGGIVLELTVTLDRHLRSWDAEAWTREHAAWLHRLGSRAGARWRRLVPGRARRSG